MDRVRGAGDAFEANADASGESSVRSPKRWLQRIIPALADVGERAIMHTMMHLPPDTSCAQPPEAPDPTGPQVTDEKKKLDIEFLTIAAPSFIQVIGRPFCKTVSLCHTPRCSAEICFCGSLGDDWRRLVCPISCFCGRCAVSQVHRGAPGRPGGHDVPRPPGAHGTRRRGHRHLGTVLCKQKKRFPMRVTSGLSLLVHLYT